MKKLKKNEKSVILNGPDLSAYKAKGEAIAREYFVLRDDVFEFLGVFTTASQHATLANLQLTNED